MANKPGKFYVDWWQIKKSTVYTTVGIVLFFIVIIGGGWWLWKNEGFVKTEVTDAPKDTAQLISFEGDVRIIRASTRETLLVTKPIFVAAGDTIQTQADGRAKVQMIDGSVLWIRPNSTVVIRDSKSIFGGTNVRVALDEGQLNVRTQDSTEGSENIVEVKETENRVSPQTDASFNINENTDGGEIRISRGSVETSVGGKKTLIKENEFASVNNGRIATREKLIQPPTISSPASGEQISASSGGDANISFQWRKSEGVAVKSYQFQVAKSPFFNSDLIVTARDSLVGQSFAFSGVSPGTYYWRVRSNTSSGQVSEWSEPARFIVIKNASGSGNISVENWGVESLGGTVYIISGKTRSGATVGTGGRETFAKGDGVFSLQISSSSSRINVSISDEKGNISRYSLNLNTASAVKQ